MNKKKLAALISALVLLALAACGKNSEVTNVDESGDYNESSAKLLVGTLEYLLDEDAPFLAASETESDASMENLLNEDNADRDMNTDDINADSTNIDEIDTDYTNTDDMNTYDTDTDDKGTGNIDSGNTAAFQISDDETKQLGKEEDIDTTDVIIYYGNGASDKLNTEVLSMEQLTAENLISELAGHNIVPIGTKVNSFDEEEKDKKKALYLDLDKAFREYLKTMNDKSEKIILASITATFLEAYDAESIVITVDGKVLETNHATYEEPFNNARKYIEETQ